MDKKQLRAIGHHLKPVVIVAGEGLSENVLAETNRALNDHELIKVKIAEDDREVRQKTAKILCEKTGSELILSIGKIACLLYTSPSPRDRG